MDALILAMKVFVFAFVWPFMALDAGVDAIHKHEAEKLERCLVDPARDECGTPK